MGSYLLSSVLISPFNQWDLFVQTWIGTQRVPALNEFFGVFTHFGSMVMMVTISLLVFLWLGVKKMWPEAVISYTCLLSAYLVMIFLKNLIARPRPVGEVFTIAYGYSFPSGHAMLSMAYYGFLACLLFSRNQGGWRILSGVGFGVLILLIGFSRIYLNVHYMSDVAAGFGLGLLVLWINWQILRRFNNKEPASNKTESR